MWQLDNRTPFSAERSWVRDRDGAEVWQVAVKASFDIRADGATRVSPQQPPVLRLPEHHGEPGRSSVKYDADLVLGKRNTDILVVGHVHAPGGKAVTQLECGFRVGGVHKLLQVKGDRAWLDKGHGCSPPQPFEKLPLRYERAYGGADAQSKTPAQDWDPRNPIGRGFVARAEHAQGVSLPNLEDPRALITDWKDRPAPAGFGPLASHWQPRAAFSGTFDEQWQRTRAPLLPEDFDERWYQSAPADQQAQGFLLGGEPVVLYNLGPHGHEGRLYFTLPRMDLAFETLFYDGSRLPHERAALHTVILEPDLPRVSLVWHTALACHAKVHQLDRTIVTLGPEAGAGEPPAVKLAARMAAREAEAPLAEGRGHG